MPPAEFEPTTLASERPKTHVLDRVATGTGEFPVTGNNKIRYPFNGIVPVELVSVPLAKNFTAFHNAF